MQMKRMALFGPLGTAVHRVHSVKAPGQGTGGGGAGGGGAGAGAESQAPPLPESHTEQRASDKGILLPPSNAPTGQQLPTECPFQICVKSPPGILRPGSAGREHGNVGPAGRTAW